MDGGARTRARAGGLAALAVSLLVSIYPSAHADQTIRRDGDDVASILDIAWVKHEHERLDNGRMRIRHTISTHDPWSARRLFHNGCAEIRIFLNGRRNDFVFYWNGKLKARLNRHQLAAWRPDGRSVAVRVRPRRLGGKDRSYRYQVRSLATDDGSCDGGERAYEDWVPSSDRWIRHDLG